MISRHFRLDCKLRIRHSMLDDAAYVGDERLIKPD